MIRLPKFKNSLKGNSVNKNTATKENITVPTKPNKFKTRVLPVLINIKNKLNAFWLLIRLKISKRLVYTLLLICLVIYLSMYFTLGYQILVNGREDSFARKAIKAFPIPVAYVGNNFIFAGDYFTRVAILEKYRASSNQAAPEDKVAYRDSIMEKVEFTEALRQLAYKNKVRITPKNTDTEYEKIISTLPDPSKAPDEIMNLYGLTVPEFKRFVSEVAIENKLLEDKIASYHIAHIMISDEKTANDILVRAQKGEDFSELAKKYSEDSYTKDSGGDLGFVDRDTVSQALGTDFENIAFGILENGQIADKLAKTDYGYHIIKLIEKKGEINMGLNEWVNDYKSKITVIDYFHVASDLHDKLVKIF